MIVGGDYEDRGARAQRRIQSEVAASARDHQAHIAIVELILADGFQDRLDQAGLFQRNFEADGLCGIVKTIDVLRQAEYPAVIEPDALKDAVAIEQTMIEDRNLGFFLSVVLPIDDRSSFCRPQFMRKNPSRATQTFSSARVRSEHAVLAVGSELKESVAASARGQTSEDQKPSAGDFLAPKRQHCVALFGSQQSKHLGTLRHSPAPQELEALLLTDFALLELAIDLSHVGDAFLSNRFDRLLLLVGQLQLRLHSRRIQQGSTEELRLD